MYSKQSNDKVYKNCIMKEKSVILDVHNDEHIELVVLRKKSFVPVFPSKSDTII